MTTSRRSCSLIGASAVATSATQSHYVACARLAELRGDADAFVPADDRIASTDVAQLAAHGPTPRRDDDRVHSLFIDLDPASVQPHVRAVVVVE